MPESKENEMAEILELNQAEIEEIAGATSGAPATNKLATVSSQVDDQYPEIVNEPP